jgi:hypothetical protein
LFLLLLVKFKSDLLLEVTDEQYVFEFPLALLKKTFPNEVSEFLTPNGLKTVLQGVLSPPIL